MARSAPPQYESNGTAAESAEALEQRVRRLEHAVAALQDTQLMEDRVVERVARRVDQHGHSNGSGPLASSAALIVNATKMLLPKVPNDAPAFEVLPQDPNAAKPAWFLWELRDELRTIVRMYYDYRFRMSWTARIVPVAGLVVYALSWLLLSNSILGLWGLIDRAVAVGVVVVVYKALSREVVRYNDLLARIRYRQ
jgi:hypothetical protein